MLKYKCDVKLKEGVWQKCSIPVTNRTSSSKYFDEFLEITSVTGMGMLFDGIPIFVQPHKDKKGKTDGYQLTCYGSFLSLKVFRSKDQINEWLSNWNPDCLKLILKYNRDLFKYINEHDGKISMKQYLDWADERKESDLKAYNSLSSKINREMYT